MHARHLLDICDILESVKLPRMSSSQIERMLTSRYKATQDPMSGGECGAVASIIAELYKSRVKYWGEIIDGAVGHVFVQIGSKYYDGQGSIPKYPNSVELYREGDVYSNKMFSADYVRVDTDEETGIGANIVTPGVGNLFEVFFGTYI